MEEPGENYRILVIDDEDEWRSLVAEGLRAKGYEVVDVDSAARGLDEAQRRKFHVAVVDYKMPGKDGLETLEALRSVDPDIEVILATGLAAERVARQAIDRGAYAFLVKPFALVELEALLPALSERIGLKALVALYEATRGVFADIQLQDLLPDLVGLARKVLGADDVSVMLLGEKGDLTLAASTSVARELWGRSKVTLGQGVAGRVAQWRTGVNIAGPLQSDPRFADLPSRPDVAYSLVYPILLNQELLGILSANRKPGRRPFLPQDLRHSAIFCSMIAQALHNAKLYDRLRTLDKLKDDFISMVSHDLRGPLHAIAMITEALGTGEYGALAPEQERMLRLIENSTRHLTAFILNILDAAKIRAGHFKIDPQPVKLQEAVPPLTQLFSISAATRGIQLGCDLPADLPPVRADAEKLPQIFNNLIANALKFTQRGGKILVEAHPDGGGWMRCAVHDTGIGIRPEGLPKLFVKFQQADPERQRELKVSGAGLGLSICKSIVEGHGGRIWAESEPGRGSTFAFTLPLCSAPPTPAPD